MEWISVEDDPLWAGNEPNYWINPRLDNELLALEIPIGHGTDVIYMIGSIGNGGIIVDGYGDDAGVTIFDVSRWAVFEPPTSENDT